MSAFSILLVYLVLAALDFGIDTALVLLNAVYASHTDLPPVLKPHIEADALEKSRSYLSVRSRFAVFTGSVSFVFTCALVLSGFFGAVDRLVAGWDLSATLEGLIYLACLGLGASLASLPFSLWSHFRVEARFGFNRMTPATFAVDTLKSIVLSGLLLLVLYPPLSWLMASTGDFWWLWAFGVFALFQIILSFLYPLVIAPLFNKFNPLPEGELRDRLGALASRLSFRTKGIFVMDGSRRSRHSNAYFTGFGKARRIVLYDTLVSEHAPDEIEAVLAHEIGHWKLGHILKNTAISLVLSFAAFALLSVLSVSGSLYTAFGFDRNSLHGLLLIVALASGPATFVFTPVFSGLSRRDEYAADRFAVQSCGGGDALAAALIRLSKDNLSNPVPHPAYSFVHYSHPTLAERLAAIGRVSKETNEDLNAKHAKVREVGIGEKPMLPIHVGFESGIVFRISD